MHFNLSQVKSKFFLFLFLIFSGFVFAQPPPPFDDDVDDELPINSQLFILGASAIAVGYFAMKKKPLTNDNKA